MAWWQITEADLLTQLSGAELAGLRKVALAAITVTGNLAAGSAVISGLSSVLGLVPGMIPTATHIPTGRSILTVDSASQVTLDSGIGITAATAESIVFGQVDPIAPAIAQVTSEVRGYVAACKNNRLGEVGTIPEELMVHAVALLVIRVIPRTAGLMLDDNKARETAASTARDVLRDVAACRFAIVQPTLESPEAVAGPGVQLLSHTHHAARRNFHKLAES